MRRQTTKTRNLCQVNNPVKKMEVAHFNVVALAGLCIPLPIKVRRFVAQSLAVRGYAAFGSVDGFGVASCLSYLARVAARAIDFSL